VLLAKSNEKYCFERNHSQHTESVAKIAGGLGSVHQVTEDELRTTAEF
jgi:hypothetical protein